jgi:hypothetical protein
MKKSVRHKPRSNTNHESKLHRQHVGLRELDVLPSLLGRSINLSGKRSLGRPLRQVLHDGAS